MRVYVMTDLEGAAGVANYPDWCMRTSPHYALACRNLTEEVNAAVAGFRASGASAITVVDGHGEGGIDRTLLDADVEYLRVRGREPYPFGLDQGYDVMAWIGQHAMAGTAYGHLPHTGNFNLADYRINGTSVGEFAQIAMSGALFDVVPFFGSGDTAFIREAQDLAPGFVGVSVKTGLNPTTGTELGAAAARDAWADAEHRCRSTVLEDIRLGAESALATADQCQPVTLANSWERSVTYRTLNGERNVTKTNEYADLLELLNDIEDVV